MQRDAVNNAEAELAFKETRYLAAASSWGKVMASKPSFEELALKFVGVGSPDALQRYLLTKLDTLAPADKAQVGHHKACRSRHLQPYKLCSTHA